MGADLILATVPACGLDEDRMAKLNAIIEALPDDDCPDYVDDIEDWRGRLADALECMNAGRRDVAELDFRSVDYPFLISGGMSWGDDPTDACAAFGVIGECQPLAEQLEAWAKEDAEPRWPPAVKELVEAVTTLLDNACDNGEAFPDEEYMMDECPKDENGRAWYGDYFALYKALKPFQPKREEVAQ